MNNQLTLTERLKLPTSKFFKPLVTGGIWVAALAAALVAFQTQLAAAGIPVPAVVELIAEGLTILSATVAGIAKLTVDFDHTETKQYLKLRGLVL
ncbi:hypothetical protein [Arsenicibacter rosenii]|uniref:Holin n=1 Tax=Arsenicibacter rosenii TaxID=1750698 RepID=A0A1S2VQV2_9BACT|nr:hypothetical protein [Arsenicibacter rosenii]OIN61167.1 hypothetical protein BLX24_03655 [Arsenicibacter rosenii]